MSGTWICAIVVFWKHAENEPEPDPVVAITHRGTETECEEKARSLREIRPEEVEVRGDGEVAEVRVVTCPEIALHGPRGLPS